VERARLERFHREDTPDEKRESGFSAVVHWAAVLRQVHLAEIVAGQLEQRGHGVEILDGDAVRNNLTKGLGFSKEDRDENIRRIIQSRRG
jgi:adenylylsulfate kinase-like enzyme